MGKSPDFKQEGFLQDLLILNIAVRHYKELFYLKKHNQLLQDFRLAKNKVLIDPNFLETHISTIDISEEHKNFVSEVIRNTPNLIINSLISSSYLIERQSFEDALGLLRKSFENISHLLYLLLITEENNKYRLEKFCNKHFVKKDKYVSNPTMKEICTYNFSRNEFIIEKFVENAPMWEEKRFTEVCQEILDLLSYENYQSLCSHIHFDFSRTSLHGQVPYDFYNQTMVEEKDILNVFQYQFYLCSSFIFILNSFYSFSELNKSVNSLPSYKIFKETKTLSDYYERESSHKKADLKGVIDFISRVIDINEYCLNNISKEFTIKNYFIDVHNMYKKCDTYYFRLRKFFIEFLEETSDIEDVMNFTNPEYIFTFFDLIFLVQQQYQIILLQENSVDNLEETIVSMNLKINSELNVLKRELKSKGRIFEKFYRDCKGSHRMIVF